MKMTVDDRRAVVAEAARAPSAHNTQPARWYFGSGRELALLEDLSCRLNVADPEGKDARIGLGAAYEGMRLALSRRGLGLADVRMTEEDLPGGPAVGPGLTVVLTASIIEGGHPDPLAEHVSSRRTFRGRFRTGDGHRASLRGFAAAREDVALVGDSDEIAVLAREHDAASARFFRREGYAAELCQWLRLSKSHERWSRDGLNAACLGLSPVERLAARAVMRPGVLGFLHRIGMIRPVVSEAPYTRSATGLLVLLAAGRTPFEAGRAFYRRWLELEADGWAACPMSALVDDPAAAERVREVAGLNSSQELVNVLRVGRASPPSVERSPRLPPDELLV